MTSTSAAVQGKMEQPGCHFSACLPRSYECRGSEPVLPCRWAWFPPVTRITAKVVPLPGSHLKCLRMVWLSRKTNLNLEKKNASQDHLGIGFVFVPITVRNCMKKKKNLLVDFCFSRSRAGERHFGYLHVLPEDYGVVQGLPQALITSCFCAHRPWKTGDPRVG